jgi:hypothetical protein
MLDGEWVGLAPNQGGVLEIESRTTEVGYMMGFEGRDRTMAKLLDTCPKVWSVRSAAVLPELARLSRPGAKKLDWRYEEKRPGHVWRGRMKLRLAARSAAL